MLGGPPFPNVGLLAPTPPVLLQELGLESAGPVWRTKANCLRVCVKGPIAVVYPEQVLWWAGMD